MATKKYLDYNGLSYFFSKLKTLINNSKTEVDITRSATVTTSTIADNSTITVPRYKVGNNSLQVYVLGEKLIKASSTAGTNGHYTEVGTTGAISTQIKLANIGQSIPKGTPIEFVVFGNY